MSFLIPPPPLSSRHVNPPMPDEPDPMVFEQAMPPRQIPMDLPEGYTSWEDYLACKRQKIPVIVRIARMWFWIVRRSIRLTRSFRRTA